MTREMIKLGMIAVVALALLSGMVMLASQGLATDTRDQAIWGRSPIPEPYAYVGGGSFSGPAVPESPDPLVAYRWPNPRAADALEIYLLKPKAVSADKPESFDNLQSLADNTPNVTVKGEGRIMLDFGVESGAWVEFDSPDCPGGVAMSISEYNEPGVRKTRAPVKHGNTYRLELNKALYP